MTSTPTTIGYSSDRPLSVAHREILRAAKTRVYGDTKVGFVPGTDIHIDTTILDTRPFPENYLSVTLARHRGGLAEWADSWDQVLFLDIESHNAGKQYGMPLREFFRLGQFAWGNGPVRLTTDLDEVLSAIAQAQTVVAHNGHSFDFSVLLGDEALPMTLQGRLFDTFVHANLVFPAPDSYTDRAGHTYRGAAAPSIAMKWLSLDNLGFQLGSGAKEGDLKALAKKHNPKGTLVEDLDYSLIPLDDPDFLAYAEQDVILLRDVFKALMQARDLEEYDVRAQKVAAINAQMMRNGIQIDADLARERVAQAEAKKNAILSQLQETYDFPTVGKAPWMSKPGKIAILRALGDNGIHPDEIEGWTFGKTGPSLAGDLLVQFTQGTPAEDLGVAVAQMGGQRPLPDQALRFMKEDGRVHPSILAIQRSGRCSITKPGMTTWSNAGDKAYEKDYIIAKPGHKLIGFDLSNADQRIVAALSGDLDYAKRFEPGVDGHEINARIMFGDEKYDEDPKARRTDAKAPGHAITYGAGVNKLVATTGLPKEDIQNFVDGFAAAYPNLARWQSKVRADGDKGWVQNRWGRKMVIDKFYHPVYGWQTRAWTQAPALHGQSGTTEVLYDGLLKMYAVDPRLISWLVCTIHDEILMEVPDEEVDYAFRIVPECVQQTINGVDFPVSYGPAGRSWHDAQH